MSYIMSVLMNMQYANEDYYFGFELASGKSFLSDESREQTLV